MKKDTFIDKMLKKVLTETLEQRADEIMEKINFNPHGSEFDYVQEGNVCECGGEMKEGECTECGMREGEVMEKLSPKQKRELDVDDDDKITAKDFKYLRRNKAETKEYFFGRDKEEDDEYFEDCPDCDGKGCKYCDYEGIIPLQDTGDYVHDEMEEGNAFTGALARAKKEGKDSFKVDGKKYNVKENNEEVLYKLENIEDSALFTEDEMIDIIERIIKEENNIKNTPTPAGYTNYKKAHTGSGKEEDDYMKLLAKKMKDYLKDGSKGDFDMNPKHFPKGNGELEKMKAKKYTMSDGGKEFLDDFMSPGMENLDYDEIHPDEDWVTDNIEGSSRTGNNPEWANAVETDLGDKINKKRKANKYAKAKRQAYRKSKQPVTDGTGDNSGSGVNIKVESVNDKQGIKLNEEFDRMKKLISYDNRTQ